MVRVATYNVENLFDRPKILNIEDQELSRTLLGKVNELNDLLRKVQYSDDDKQRILDLYSELTGYIDIQEDVGKLFSRQRYKITRVKANGWGDWYGGIVLLRAAFGDKQRTNTATLLEYIDADIQCIIEADGNQALSDFNRHLLKKRFTRHLLIDSPIDPRGIDVGVYARNAELGSVRTNVFDRANGKAVWSRDCLEIEFVLSSGKSLHLLANHFKSKFGGDTPESLAKRRGQAERVVEIVSTRYDPSRDFVIVAGDLNDTPDSEALQPLAGYDGLVDVFDVVDHPADDRWTYYYHPNAAAKRRTQIDYIYVSPALVPLVRKVEVFRRGMSAVAEGRIPGVEPYPGFDNWKVAASDHAAIAVDLDL